MISTALLLSLVFLFNSLAQENHSKGLQVWVWVWVCVFMSKQFQWHMIVPWTQNKMKPKIYYVSEI